MSYNGSGTFQINTSGQPVVAGTVISSTAFNALTADLATGLSTAITKDGQTTTTTRIPFAQGISSTLTTDSSSVSTGSIITDGGVGIAKNLYVGVNANIAGTLNVTGSTTLTNPVINNIKMGYSTTATAAGTTTLSVSSNYRQFFTGTLAQTIVLPVTSTLVTGMAFEIENNSTGLLTVNSSGGNLVGTVPAGVCAHAVCIGTTLTTAADWDWDYIATTTITGTGANVLGTSPTITSPTITTPTIDTITSSAATSLILKSAGTTAITVDTSQNVTIAGLTGTGSRGVNASATGVLSAASSAAPTTQIFTSGSGNYTSPAGVKSIRVTLVGGGGGGGGINGSGAAGGGGGGATALWLYPSGFAAQTAYAYAVGGSGAGGVNTSASSGGTGGGTTFTIGGTTVTAGGGIGGSGSLGGTGGGGVGGTATNGTVNIVGGGGGESYGPSLLGGTGGSSTMGGGGRQAFGTATPGGNYGGGGAGAVNNAALAGGAGAGGLIIVEEFYI